MTETKMDRDALLRRIQEFVRWGFYVRATHARFRQNERRISDTEVFQVIDEGAISDGPEYDQEFENWVVTIEAEVDEGDRIAVRVACDLAEEVVTFITAWGI